jgi:hypothetical protein
MIASVVRPGAICRDNSPLIKTGLLLTLWKSDVEIEGYDRGRARKVVERTVERGGKLASVGSCGTSAVSFKGAGGCPAKCTATKLIRTTAAIAAAIRITDRPEGPAFMNDGSNYRSSETVKLGVRSDIELVYLCMRQGLVASLAAPGAA